jgi:hypothetical protein
LHIEISANPSGTEICDIFSLTSYTTTLIFDLLSTPSDLRKSTVVKKFAFDDFYKRQRKWEEISNQFKNKIL